MSFIIRIKYKSNRAFALQFRKKAGRGLMAKFGIKWINKTKKYVEVIAETEGEAMEIWNNSDYDYDSEIYLEEAVLPERLGGRIECMEVEE